ncbi:hypothetical protein FC83_GL001985 [Agrilactobacillus composti DSM 18527 = JCM 14202]|uniref:HAD superfamily hydrolase n=1 Tax=Agrilactobacillus composti DSM 18527 = JCM 14202 TaxID=1423734 RepID=A0A0R1XXC9_9LACO|nr:HAD-IIB family hydrolase [Agrilactobacillus composti]KRM34848.1 hypothetical protein FC83_GL001985 [Agrilactobacillus composti DSM 18527 = JCM 14202]
MIKKTKYQVICSDLDGTLLNSNKVIDPKDQATIQAWQAAGNFFGITSGRTLWGVHKALGSSITPDFIVYLNGAYVQTIQGRLVKRLLANQLSLAVLTKIAPITTAKLMVVLGDQTRRVVDTPKQADEITKNQLVGMLQQATPPLLSKISLVTPDDAVDQQVYQLVADMPVAVTTSDVHYVEIASQNVSKLSGLEIALADTVPLDRVIAMGDYANDLEIISGVGCGYAVANAVPIIKQAAQKVTVDHDHQPMTHIVAEITDQLDQ